MNGSLYTIAHGLIWVSQACYILCLVPQIIKNTKMGTTVGFSDVLLFGFLNGYFAVFYYLFCLKLPFAYKAMNTVQFVALLGLVAQRIHYDESISYKRFEYCLWGNSAAALFFLPIAMVNPAIVGMIAGWLAAAFFSMSYISQIVRIFVTKSVAGFSFLFVLITLLGVVLELIAANILGLPSQTHATLWRALVVCCIFLVQFKLYT